MVHFFLVHASLEKRDINLSTIDRRHCSKILSKNQDTLVKMFALYTGLLLDDPDKSSFETCETPDKGRALVATKDIRSGTILLEEKPILHVSTPPSELSANSVFERIDRVVENVTKLRADRRKAYTTLYAGTWNNADRAELRSLLQSKEILSMLLTCLSASYGED